MGAREDSDGDPVVGTRHGGLDGVSHNGHVIVVTSGRFMLMETLKRMPAARRRRALGSIRHVRLFNNNSDIIDA